MIRSSLAVLVAALFATTLVADEPDLEGVKCAVNPKAAAKASASAEYMDGKVYFCCGGCKSKFEKDSDKYASNANYQLVATEQYTQKACPFSGGDVDEAQTTKVGKTEIGFCCGGCKGKVEGAEDDAAKIEMVFAKAAFEKGFEATDDENDLSGVKCPMMGEDVSADFAIDYMGGKVYVCCESCIDEYKEDPDSYTAAFNQQLVQTKQFTQTGCPFSGGKVNDETKINVGDVKVGFCCNGCKGKVEGAEDDDTRLVMVFSKDAFKKGFKKAEK